MASGDLESSRGEGSVAPKNSARNGMAMAHVYNLQNFLASHGYVCSLYMLHILWMMCTTACIFVIIMSSSNIWIYNVRNHNESCRHRYTYIDILERSGRTRNQSERSANIPTQQGNTSVRCKTGCTAWKHNLPTEMTSASPFALRWVKHWTRALHWLLEMKMCTWLLGSSWLRLAGDIEYSSLGLTSCCDWNGHARWFLRKCFCGCSNGSAPEFQAAFAFLESFICLQLFGELFLACQALSKAPTWVHATSLQVSQVFSLFDLVSLTDAARNASSRERLQSSLFLKSRVISSTGRILGWPITALVAGHL